MPEAASAGQVCEPASLRARRPNGRPSLRVDVRKTEDSPFKTAKEQLISDFERSYLEQLMAWAGGNVSRASRKAKLDRMYLHRLLQRYEIKRDED